MAARIAGVSLPQEKPICVGLTAIYGIGNSTAKTILTAVKVSPQIRVKDLTEEQVNRIREALEARKQRVEGELRREMLGSIKRLREINCYRGVRHMKNLPVRGQRTKTNSRTVRGNVRKTMGSGRRLLTKT